MHIRIRSLLLIILISSLHIKISSLLLEILKVWPIISHIKSGFIRLAILSLLYFSLRLSFKRLFLLSKMWHIHTMEHYSALKRNGVLVHATTRTDRDNILLRSGRSRSQEMTCCVIPRTWDVQNGPTHSDREQLPRVGAWGGNVWGGGIAKGYRVSFWGNQNAAQWTAVMAAQLCE